MLPAVVNINVNILVLSACFPPRVQMGHKVAIRSFREGDVGGWSTGGGIDTHHDKVEYAFVPPVAKVLVVYSRAEQAEEASHHRENRQERGVKARSLQP